MTGQKHPQRSPEPLRLTLSSSVQCAMWCKQGKHVKVTRAPRVSQTRPRRQEG